MVFLALLTSVFLAFPTKSDGALVLAFEQSGDDVIVSAQGFLDIRGFSPSWSAWDLTSGEIRQLGGGLPQDVIRLFGDSVSAFEFGFGLDIFTEDLAVQVADEFSGDTFGLWSDGAVTQMYVSRSFVSGDIESWMTFRDLELDSVGVVEQTFSFGGNESTRIEIKVVPEPGVSCFLLFFFTFFNFRRVRVAPNLIRRL